MKPSLAKLLALTSVLNSFAADSTPSCIPNELAPLEHGKPTAYLTKISDIPGSVVDGSMKAIRGAKFHMADRNAAWNETDVVSDPALPFRRLLWATEIQKYFVIHYERGGRGYSTHFLVLSPEDKVGNRALVWSAVSFGKAADFSEFLRLVEVGKANADPKFSH